MRTQESARRFEPADSTKLNDKYCTYFCIPRSVSQPPQKTLIPRLSELTKIESKSLTGLQKKLQNNDEEDDRERKLVQVGEGKARFRNSKEKYNSGFQEVI
jgi:hypothetical protein